MTPRVQRRIARVRPLAPAQAPGSGSAELPEQFFVASDAGGFEGSAGRIWTVVESPFPGSRANAASNRRQGWEPGAEVTEESFTFLAPCVPANVLGMAHNTGQAGRDLPAQAFHKAATSVIGPGEAIELPAGIGLVEPEAELAVVVGRTAKNLTLDDAQTAILGFTIANDVTARRLQQTDELWLSAKSQDTFTPAGPWIVTGLDPAELPVGVVHNGTELPAASTADLGWKVEEILVYLTSFMTLHPGDLVLTGFPAASAGIQPGDSVTCRVGGIGELTNPVTAAG